MRGRAKGFAATLAAALVLAGPTATAAAEELIVAVPQSTYANPNVTLERGEALTFVNGDFVEHDVTSVDSGSDGKLLFRSELIGTAEQAPVEGAAELKAGSYPFICSVHSFMTGTLTVTGGGGGGGGDGDPPKVKLRILDSSLREVTRAGELTVRVKVDEPASVRLGAKARVGRKTVGLGKEREKVGKGSQKVEIGLSKSGERALRKADSAKVSVKAKAKDSAGDTATAKTSKKLD